MANEIYKTIGDLPAVTALGAENMIEVMVDGVSQKMPLEEARKFKAYDVGVGSTAQLNTDNQVFVVQNTDATAKAIKLPTGLVAGRARTIVVVIYGKVGGVTWDANIFWSDATAPVLATNVTVAVLLWDGTRVHGTPGAAY